MATTKADRKNKSGTESDGQNMLEMRKPGPEEKYKVMAILCSDLHLCHTAPVARASKDWYVTMRGYLKELKWWAEHYKAPVICAGDIFDYWNPPAQLINFAIAELPKMYAIPGQHDLPNHSYEDIQKSGYWTLVQAGTIINLEPGLKAYANKNRIVLHGFPWGHEITPIKPDTPTFPQINLAVAHSYIYMKGCHYPGVAPSKHYARYHAMLRGFDAAVFGDNHKGFVANMYRQPRIMNCGAFMRRHSDEMDYRPQIGLLLASGMITSRKLNVSDDLWNIAEFNETIIDPQEAGSILKLLESLTSDEKSSIDFRMAVTHWLGNTSVGAQVKQIIREALQL